MASNNTSKEGPTILWNLLKNKKVKTNDGKTVGEIKEISQNYLRLEKGTFGKEKYWIPRYLADAFDEVLWLLINEDDLKARYLYGEQPQAEEYTKDFETLKSTPTGQKATYSVDENVRVVENYKNIRDPE
jgi:hypothetical protein